MIELPFEYLNKLTYQLLITSSLLCGFSLAITANQVSNKSKNKVHQHILKAATVSSGSFLVSVFALTNIMMKTTAGYPIEVASGELNSSRIVGILCFLVGITALLTVLAFSGWTKSKDTGIFTTVVSVLTLILIVFFI